MGIVSVTEWSGLLSCAVGVLFGVASVHLFVAPPVIWCSVWSSLSASVCCTSVIWCLQPWQSWWKYRYRPCLSAKACFVFGSVNLYTCMCTLRSGQSGNAIQCCLLGSLHGSTNTMWGKEKIFSVCMSCNSVKKTYGSPQRYKD